MCRCVCVGVHVCVIKLRENLEVFLIINIIIIIPSPYPFIEGSCPGAGLSHEELVAVAEESLCALSRFVLHVNDVKGLDPPDDALPSLLAQKALDELPLLQETVSGQGH